MIRRGDLWWADLPDPQGSAAGFRRPVVIIQADAFNSSRIASVIVATVSSNLQLASAPGNVLIRARESKLPRDSVVNVSQIATLDKAQLESKIGTLPDALMLAVDDGLRTVLEV